MCLIFIILFDLVLHFLTFWIWILIPGCCVVIHFLQYQYSFSEFDTIEHVWKLHCSRESSDNKEILTRLIFKAQR